MTEQTHTDFEIAIERELHGALDEAGAIALAAHLVGCSSCRAYQQTAIETETNMEAIGNLFSQGVAWGRVKTAVDARVGDERARFRLSVVVVVGFVAASLIYYPLVRHRMPHLDVLAIMTAAMCGGLYLAWRRLRGLEQRAKEAATSSNDLFAVLAQANRQQTRQAWVGIAIGGLGGVIFVPDLLHKQSASGWFVVGVFLASLIECTKRLLRLRRERAAFLR